jgi:hypothetical protein
MAHDKAAKILCLNLPLACSCNAIVNESQARSPASTLVLWPRESRMHQSSCIIPRAASCRLCSCSCVKEGPNPPRHPEAFVPRLIISQPKSEHPWLLNPYDWSALRRPEHSDSTTRRRDQPHLLDFFVFARWGQRPDVVAAPLPIRHHVVSAFLHPLQEGTTHSIILSAALLKASRPGTCACINPQVLGHWGRQSVSVVVQVVRHASWACAVRSAR